MRERDERAVALLKQQTSAPARVGPSLPLERYAGEFADAWYGPIAIAHRDGRLTIDFKQTPGMIGRADALAVRHVPRRSGATR